MVDDDNRDEGNLEPEQQGEGSSEQSGPRRSTWTPPGSTSDTSGFTMSDDDLARVLEEDFERTTHTGAHSVIHAEEPSDHEDSDTAGDVEAGIDAVVEVEVEEDWVIEADTDTGVDNDNEVVPDGASEPEIEFIGFEDAEPGTVYSLDDAVLPEADEHLTWDGAPPAERRNLWETAVGSSEFESKFEAELTPEPEPEPESTREPTAVQHPDTASSPAPQPPVRRSIPTSELAATLAASAQSGGDPSTIMARLEEQLVLREQDVAEFQRWQDRMVTERGSEALADVESAREEFVDIFEGAVAQPPGSDSNTPTLEAHTFGIDEILDSRLISAPAPMTAPISDIPPPPSHILTSTPVQDTPSPSREPMTDPAELAFAEKLSEPVTDTFGHAAPPSEEPESGEPEVSVPAPPTIPDLIEPTESAAAPDPFDFDALIGGVPTSAQEEPSAFSPGPDGDPISLDSEAIFDTEPGRDETVSDTDRVFADLAGPFPVTSEGVTILPEPITGLVPPISSAGVSSAGIPVVEVPMSSPRAFKIEDSSVEPTLKDQRVGRASRLFWMWFAANSSIVSLAFGGAVLSLGMSLRQAIVATLIGVAVSCLPLGLGTLAGKWSGQPTMIVSRASFGHVGNILPAVLAIVVRVFWGAVLLWFLAAGTARILTGSELGGPLSEPQLVIIGLAVGFLLALVIAFFGYGLIARVQMIFTIISAVLIAGLIYITWPAVNFPAALTLGDGPWILVLTGAVLVFSFVGLVWAVSSADLARYQRVKGSGASSMLWSTFGATIPAFVLIAYGAILAASNPDVASGLIETPLDTLSELMPVWYPIPLIAALAFSLLSGVVVSIYSGGFALQATGASMRRSAAVVIVGVAVAVLAVLIAVSVGDFTLILRDVATSFAVPIAAWAGIFAAEMMIRNKRFVSQALVKRGGVYGDVRWVNLSMLIVASGIGFGLTTATVSWLSWQGYLFEILGIPLSSDLAATDLGVFAALLLGLLTPLVAGFPAIRRQEAEAIRQRPVVAD